MAYYDRPYYRDEVQRSPFSGMRGQSVVVWLLGINFVVFLVDAVLRGSSRGHWLAPYFAGNFNVDQAIFGFQVWRFATYQFLHGDFFHLLFNLIALFFFGPMLEQWWGPRRFLAFYLLCGMMGAVLFTAFVFMPGLIDVSRNSQLVGASGSIFGILIAAAVLFPHQRVMFMMIIPMTMRVMALFFLGMVFLSLLAGGRNAGGDAAHLGGALLGYLLVKRPHWLNWADRDWLGRLRPGEIRQKYQRKRWERHVQTQRELEAEVDRILDKVQREGIQSLSGREKKTLQRATREKQRS